MGGVCVAGVEQAPGAAVPLSLVSRLETLAGGAAAWFSHELIHAGALHRPVYFGLRLYTREICNSRKTYSCNDRKYLYRVVPSGLRF